MMRIVDKLGRPIRDLRLSVTDRCNFRCRYCMPKEIFHDDFPFLTSDQLLSFAEMRRLVEQFVQLGVTKVRITGGEPLLRKNLPDFIEEVATIRGIDDVALTTNGVLLAKYAEALKRAGLKRVNVSLDSLDERTFAVMNGRGFPVKPILEGIEVAQEVGLEVKVNMVVIKGVNDDEILSMARYFREKRITLRFIEFMDVGNTNGWKRDDVVFADEIIEILAKNFPLSPVTRRNDGEVAKRYRYVDSDVDVGLITSVSNPFCTTCTRVRVSADGKMYTCLFATKGEDLKPILRYGTERELRERLISVWTNRADRYSEERFDRAKRNDGIKVEMHRIGG